MAGFLGGAFLRSGRLRGPGEAFKNAGGFAPYLFEDFPGPPGPARRQKCTSQNAARLPSGAQLGAWLGLAQLSAQIRLDIEDPFGVTRRASGVYYLQVGFVFLR